MAGNLSKSRTTFMAHYLSYVETSYEPYKCLRPTNLTALLSLCNHILVIGNCAEEEGNKKRHTQKTYFERATRLSFCSRSPTGPIIASRPAAARVCRRLSPLSCRVRACVRAIATVERSRSSFAAKNGDDRLRNCRFAIKSLGSTNDATPCVPFEPRRAFRVMSITSVINLEISLGRRKSQNNDLGSWTRRDLHLQRLDFTNDMPFVRNNESSIHLNSN